MVNNWRAKRRWIVPVILACVIIILSFNVAALAQDEEPTIEEDYVVELNGVGDGHIVDTIKYSKDDYEVIKETSKENKGFLTRRYSAVDYTGELVDFKTEFDDDKESVVITYDMPGYAYTSDGSWMVYGFNDKPKKESNLTFETTETSTVNSEFTLFTDQVIETTTIIELPEDAKNAKYDSNEKAITYETTPAKSLLGFWSENRILLLIIFGVLSVLFLALLAFVMTRKPKTVEASLQTEAAAATQPVDPQTVSQQQTGGYTPPPAAPQPQPPAEETGGETTVYCTNCGNEIPKGRHFCIHCGKALK